MTRLNDVDDLGAAQRPAEPLRADRVVQLTPAGPALPALETATSASLRSSAAIAMVRATGSLTAPKRSSEAGSIPNRR